METPRQHVVDQVAARAAVELVLPAIERAMSDRLRVVAEARAASAIRGPFLPDA